MKIRKISIKDHPILGDLELDFTNQNGNVYDTIVFAGENGCGKTTILSLLFELTKFGHPYFQSLTYKGKISIDISEREIEIITQNMRNRGYTPSKLITNNINRIVIEFERIHYSPQKGYEGVTIHWCKNDSIVLTQTDGYNIIGDLSNISKFLYQDTEIDSQSRVETIKTSNLDEMEVYHTKSTQKTAQGLAQLLVDINTIDANETVTYLDQYGNAPESIRHQRIKRFNNAFQKIFSHLSFSRVVAENNEHKVLFLNYGKEVALNNLSSGEKQIIFRGGFFLRDIKNINDEIAFIDEPEISLHPSWQEKILSYYRNILQDGEGKAQLFVATHSPFVVHSRMENTKYIILKRNEQGNIEQVQNATYPDICGEKLVQEAFNIDWHKNNKKNILFAEDKYIQTYKIAWLKLNDIECNKDNFKQKFDDNATFCIYPTEGASNLSGFLRCQNIEYFKDKKVIGLFDFDIEGITQFDNCHNKSFWKDCQIEGDELSGRYKKRKDHNCFVAMLLPVPAEFIEYNKYGFVSNFVAQEHLLPKSFLEANNFIEEYILPIPNGPTVYKAKEEKKSEIWKKTFDLTKDDFTNFKILFDSLDKIWQDN